jgi:hypothetical protein
MICATKPFFAVNSQQNRKSKNIKGWLAGRADSCEPVSVEDLEIPSDFSILVGIGAWCGAVSAWFFRHLAAWKLSVCGILLRLWRIGLRERRMDMSQSRMGTTGGRFGLSVRRAEIAVIRDEIVGCGERIVSSWEGRQHLPSVWRRRPICLPGDPPSDKR